MSLADQSLQFFPVSARVSVLRARGLRIKGKDGTNDTYTVLQAGRETFRTPVAEKRAEPVWGGDDAAFIFTLPAESTRPDQDGVPLQVRVLHRVPLGADKLLGLTVINVHELRQNSARENPQWFKLLNKAGKADKERGEVQLDIQFLKSSMSVSMIDLSDKSHSRLGKFKDKLRGKKKDGLSDSASAILPSVSQVLTDSEGEMDGEMEGEVTKKKKNKLKSLFVPKSNMKRNSLSQSLSSLGTLPDKNSSISSSTSSGLNVESSEGKKKKKFTFLTHKRNGSTDSKASNHSDFTLGSTNQNPPSQIDICINGSHVYREQTQSDAMQDMEEEEEGEKEEEEERWRREEEEREQLEEERRREAEEERKRKEKEMQRKKEEEEKERIRVEREKEEERRRTEEEKERIRMERVKEEERRRMEEEEKERIRMERKIEEQRRRIEEEEKERIRIEREVEEQKRRMDEEKERIRLEREKEEQRRRMAEEKERIRMEREKEEERRRMEEEEKERIRMEREKEEQRRRIDEKEKERIRMEREIEGRRRIEEQEKERIRIEREKEEQKRRIDEEEKERIRLEREKEEEEKGRQRIKKEEQMRKLEEEERMRIKREKEEQIKKLEEERKRKEEREAKELRRKMEENDRKKAEEDEKMRIAEEERMKEEKRRAEREQMIEEEEKKKEQKRIEMERRLADEKKAWEEEEKRIAEEKEKQRKEEGVREEKERKRAEMEIKRKQEEQERRNMETEEKKKREKQMREEQERLKKEEHLFEESIIPQSTDFTRSARISNIKPSVSISATVSQPSMANTNPFLDDNLDAKISDNFISVEKTMAKKGRAPLPPQLTGPDVSSSGFPKQHSHLKEVSKRPAPQPPGILKVDREVTAKEYQDDQAGLGQGAKKTPESKVSLVLQDDLQVDTNPFTSDGPVSIKHNKRPAPKPGIGICVSEDKPRNGGTNLTEGMVHLKEKTSASDSKGSPPKLNLLKALNVIKVKDAKSDLTDDLSQREEHLEHIVEPDSAKSNAPSCVSWNLGPEPLVCKTDGLTSMERYQKKSQAPLPPTKPKRTGDPSIAHQQPSLPNKTNLEQAQENQNKKNASVSCFEMPAVSTPSSFTVSSATFSPLAEKLQVKKHCATESVETGSGSGSRTKMVPNDPGEVREQVAPTSVIRQHAVKPLNTAENQPENHESRVTDKTQPKTKAAEATMKGPYSQLTQTELISLALRQQEQISQRDAKIQELELYIDNLLVRVMEEKPSILMTMNTKNKSM